MRNWKQDKQRIERVMDRICLRIKKRVSILCDENPIGANSILSSDWSTKAEKGVIHACKQALIPLSANADELAVKKHRLLIKISNKLKLNRAVLRKQCAGMNYSEMLQLLS